MQGVGRGPPDTPASFPEPGCHCGPPVPGACPRRDKHGDPAYQRCRQSGTPPRTAIHGLAALMLTTCCLCGTAPVASMKPAGRPPRPGLRPSGRDPQWRPRPAVPVLDGPQGRVPGRAELRLFKPGHPRCPRRCSVVRCVRKLLEPWTTALATGEPALRSFVTGLRADQDAVTAGSHGHKGAAAAWFGRLPVIGARKHPKRAHLAQSSAGGDAEPVRWLDPEVTRW